MHNNIHDILGIKLSLNFYTIYQIYISLVDKLIEIKN